jgi:hypothetical protein
LSRNRLGVAGFTPKITCFSEIHMLERREDGVMELNVVQSKNYRLGWSYMENNNIVISSTWSYSVDSDRGYIELKEVCSELRNKTLVRFGFGSFELVIGSIK